MINIGNIGITNLFLGSTQVSKAYLGDIQVWPIENNYVTFTAQQANSTIGLYNLSTYQTLEYSTDKVTWNTFDTSVTITLANIGDEVYIRGVLSGNNTFSNYTQFRMTGLIAASGNCNALWNYEDLDVPLKQYCGVRMFYGCSSLTTAPELPATTLADWCYASMFNGCTSLTSAPELPATTLADYCYNGMFVGCTSLTTAPLLPATTLASLCYNGMFNGCTSLTTAPLLPATTLATSCYANMFYGCTSLTTAPLLPATTLVNKCYFQMFYGCTNLNYIKCLATDISSTNCTGNWVKNVAPTGTFIKNPSMTSWTTGDSGIPTGWMIENA